MRHTTTILTPKFLLVKEEALAVKEILTYNERAKKLWGLRMPLKPKGGRYAR
jgi:hypothetical protein